MRQRMLELNTKYGNPQALRLAYILFVLLAMAVAGGAPPSYSTGH